MKKLLLALLLIPSLAFAQETRLQATNSLMAFGMPGPLAEKVAGLSTGLGVLQGNINYSGNTSIRANTADAADNASLNLAGGGTSSETRGGTITVNGNEVASLGGTIFIRAGNVATGNIDNVLINSASAVRVLNNTTPLWSFARDGTLSAPLSGATVAIQEATSATACMGVATPNGTTPVAVTTSCATTGARVFYTRVGAVTNMGTISTTTAPSGTGFSFASTGASDTLASSVVYLIVKEAA